ncbi:hypothetical protein LSCM1_07428 [Leishmania martiniquensis]|uniref:C-type lectin domain-containing protein n=1 Tax=Leishmania martiniquensis TaxID=1580590 RepID=A0A836HTS5_9TRYP|nr:hypothetical protein LSCM1_07428 [Leishmania martiniquensis]
MRPQPLRRSGSLPSTMAALASFVICLASSIASAGVFLAPSDSKVPFSGFDQLQALCTAVQAGSTPVSVYTDAMTSIVENLMREKKVAEAYVSAYLNADRQWLWFVYEGSQATTMLVDSRRWASGNPTGPHTTYRYAAYSTTDGGLISSAGYDTYPVVCSSEKKVEDSPPKRFPWWGTLIVVLAVVVALVGGIVGCCCWRKKRRSNTEDEDSECSFRNDSFDNGGSAGTSSRKSDGSASSFAGESQRDGSPPGVVA